MSFVVVGLNHRTAPIRLLESIAIAGDELPKALAQLANYQHVSEGAILSTCNRIEVYAAVTKFHGGAQDLRNFLAEFRHVAPEDFVDHLYTYHDDGAARHLFRVASGIDSMVVGESEILGQVRRAYQTASAEGLVGEYLRHVFPRALHVGKRARTETAIGRNPASVSSAAVELARRALADKSLEDKRVVVVGVGKMGALAMKALARAGAAQVTLVNRTEEVAERLAGEFGAESLPFSALPRALATADIVLSSTTAPQTVIDARTVRAAMTGREERPLLIVDIAVPHDVADDVATVPGVVVRDLEDLGGVVEASIGSRLGEVVKVEEIVAEELERYVEWQRVSEFAPTVAGVVARADAVRATELERAAGKLHDLTNEERAAVDHLTRRIVSKLLHIPIARAKELSQSARGELYLDALRELFDVDEED